MFTFEFEMECDELLRFIDYKRTLRRGYIEFSWIQPNCRKLNVNCSVFTEILSYARYKKYNCLLVCSVRTRHGATRNVRRVHCCTRIVIDWRRGSSSRVILVYSIYEKFNNHKRDVAKICVQYDGTYVSKNKIKKIDDFVDKKQKSNADNMRLG